MHEDVVHHHIALYYKIRYHDFKRISENVKNMTFLLWHILTVDFQRV